MIGNDLKSVIEEALLLNTLMGQAMVTVEEQDGIITLKGIVESENDIRIAEEIITQIEGVVQVKNNLTVAVD